jgi:hypothetical protein
LNAKFHSCLPAAIVTIHHEPKGKANIENFQQCTLWNFGSGTQNLGVPQNGCFSTKSWSKDLDYLGVPEYPHNLGILHMTISCSELAHYSKGVGLP